MTAPRNVTYAGDLAALDEAVSTVTRSELSMEERLQVQMAIEFAGEIVGGLSFDEAIARWRNRRAQVARVLSARVARAN